MLMINKQRRDVGSFLERQKVRSQRDWMRKLKIFERVLFSVGIVLLGLAALYGLYKVIFMSRIFSVAEIRVDGGFHYTTANGIAMLSGVNVGDNLFSMDAGAVRARLHMEPWVKYAAVRRKLPNTLCIHIEEHEPMALALSGGSLFYMNDEAQIFKKAEASDEKDLPILTGLDIEGDGSLTETESLRAETMLFIAGFFRQSRFLSERGIAEINYDSVNGYSIITLEKPMRILLGHTAVEDRLGTVDRLFAEIRNRPGRIQYMLANESGRVVVKYASS